MERITFPSEPWIWNKPEYQPRPSGLPQTLSLRIIHGAYISATMPNMIAASRPRGRK